MWQICEVSHSTARTLLHSKSIGTQQLDFLGNCQCRLNSQLFGYVHRSKKGPKYPCLIPHKWEILAGTVLGHCCPFRGLFLKQKQGIFGYRIALLTFDNDYLLGNIYWYSIAAHLDMGICETCFLVQYFFSNTILRSLAKLRSHWLKLLCHLAILAFHMQGVSPFDKYGWARTWGVKCGIDNSCISIKLIFACDWLLQSQILLGFPDCSWWMKCSADPFMFKHCLKLKSVR